MRGLAGVRPPPAGDHLARRVGWPSVVGQRAWAKQELEDLKIRVLFMAGMRRDLLRAREFPARRRSEQAEQPAEEQQPAISGQGGAAQERQDAAGAARVVALPQPQVGSAEEPPPAAGPPA
eukprot:10632826-Alexandrium_andersonii.AAC.1